jgi:hypothetical protein
MATPKRNWDLLLVLPNLSLGQRESMRSTAFEICSLANWRIKNSLRLKASNAVAKRIARKYRSVWGRQYKPAVLIARASATNQYSGQHLRDFRNVCAIAAVVGAHSQSLQGHGGMGSWLVRWSDSFVLGRFVAGHTGVLSLDGSSTGYWTEDHLDTFRGTALETVDTPEHFSLSISKILYMRLRLLLDEPGRLSDTPREQLFRSLAMAFHAARYPSDGLTESYDLGVRVALWVGAFEALLNPKKHDVSKATILRFFDAIPWEQTSLGAGRYPEFNKSKRRIGRTCFAGAVYQRLYYARNQFLHGSETNSRILRLRGRNLLQVAPVIFGLALSQFVKSATDPVDEYEEYFWGQGDLEKALEASRKRPTTV